MNGLDWVLVAIALLSVARGLVQGAVAQVFGIAGVLGGFIVAAHYYQPLTVTLSRDFPSLGGSEAFSFILLFLLAWFCIGMVGFFISRLLHHTGLGIVDRLFGGIIGFGKAVALGVIIVSVLTFFFSPESRFLHGSRFSPHLQDVARFIINATPESVQNRFDQKRKELERYWLDQKKAAESPQSPAKK